MRILSSLLMREECPDAEEAVLDEQIAVLLRQGVLARRLAKSAGSWILQKQRSIDERVTPEWHLRGPANSAVR